MPCTSRGGSCIPSAPSPPPPRGRAVAAAAQRFAGGQLHERVPEGGSDEIGELKKSFNLMATSIERQQRELASKNLNLERLATELQTVLDATIDGIVLTDL